jgi:hypothetical protein
LASTAATIESLVDEEAVRCGCPAGERAVVASWEMSSSSAMTSPRVESSLLSAGTSAVVECPAIVPQPAS